MSKEKPSAQGKKRELFSREAFFGHPSLQREEQIPTKFFDGFTQRRSKREGEGFKPIRNFGKTNKDE